MKYCKKCGILYSSDACPGCGIEYPQKEAQRPLTAEEKAQQKRHWVGILIGVPLMIGAIYLVITLLFGK